jgi:hypothetical protein
VRAATREHRGGEVVAQHPQDGARALPAAGELLHGLGQLGSPPFGEVLDGRHHEVVLGREVVELRPAAHPRPLGDQGRRRPGEAALDQQLDGRLEQPGPHGT